MLISSPQISQGVRIRIWGLQEWEVVTSYCEYDLYHVNLPQDTAHSPAPSPSKILLSLLLFPLSCSSITLSQCPIHFSIKTSALSLCHLPKSTSLAGYRFRRLLLLLAHSPFRVRFKLFLQHILLCITPMLTWSRAAPSYGKPFITISSGLNLIYPSLVYRFNNIISYSKINLELNTFYLYLFPRHLAFSIHCNSYQYPWYIYPSMKSSLKTGTIVLR